LARSRIRRGMAAFLRIPAVRCSVIRTEIPQLR
jgi:hypothetical protein